MVDPTVFQTWFTEPQKLIANGFVRDYPQLKSWGGMRRWIRHAGALSHEGKVEVYLGMGRSRPVNLQILEDVGLVDDWDGDGILDIQPDGPSLSTDV